MAKLGPVMGPQSRCRGAAWLLALLALAALGGEAAPVFNIGAEEPVEQVSPLAALRARAEERREGTAMDRLRATAERIEGDKKTSG